MKLMLAAEIATRGRSYKKRQPWHYRMKFLIIMKPLLQEEAALPQPAVEAVCTRSGVR